MTHQELDAILEGIYSGNSPGALLSVQSDQLNLNYLQSRGAFSKASGAALKTSDGFRIASMSKTFTGTLVMQLAEQGVLDLGTPLAEFLDVAAMPVAEGYRPEQVTLQHLLNHTSGLSDFAMSREWGRRVRAKPSVFRKPTEILAFAFEHGEVVGPPGQQYHYSDSGYVALGLVLEKVTGRSWGDQCRRQIIEPLQMKNTWLEGYESPRSTLSHTYVGDFDGLAIHGSTDWAAGGHVSTAKDLELFLRGLFAGQLFTHSATLEQMLGGVATDIGSYGAGIGTRVVAGNTVHAHGGFWGSFMAIVPALSLTIVGTANNTDANNRSVVDSIVRLFSRER